MADISQDYAVALETAAPGVVNVIDQVAKPGENWTDALVRTLPVLAATAQQYQILQVQVERARQGLPPLDSSQYGAGVNVGLSADTLKIVLYAGLAVAAAIWFSRRKR